MRYLSLFHRFMIATGQRGPDTMGIHDWVMQTDHILKKAVRTAALSAAAAAFLIVGVNQYEVSAEEAGYRVSDLASCIRDQETLNDLFPDISGTGNGNAYNSFPLYGNPGDVEWYFEGGDARFVEWSAYTSAMEPEHWVSVISQDLSAEAYEYSDDYYLWGTGNLVLELAIHEAPMTIWVGERQYYDRQDLLASVPAAETGGTPAGDLAGAKTYETGDAHGEEGPAQFIPWEEAGVKDHRIDFKDAGAEMKVRRIVDIPSHEIYLSDLWDLTEISLTPVDDLNKIKDISFVAELKNLTSIILNDNEITDLSPVAELPNLEGLFFNSNQVSDLGPLKGLENIHSIDMSNNPITDYSALGSLTGLESIHSFNNGITDAMLPGYIEQVKGLPNLEKLDLGSNPFSDYTALSQMTQITSLSLWHSDIDNQELVKLVSAIRNLPKLNSLSLKYNNISDVSPIAELTGLTRLVVTENPVSDVTPLAGLSLTDLQWDG